MPGLPPDLEAIFGKIHQKKHFSEDQPPRKHWFWLTGEPIHPSMDSDGGDCAAYHKRKGDSKATITDDKCNEKRPGYICQFRSNLLQIIAE